MGNDGAEKGRRREGAGGERRSKMFPPGGRGMKNLSGAQRGTRIFLIKVILSKVPSKYAV